MGGWLVGTVWSPLKLMRCRHRERHFSSWVDGPLLRGGGPDAEIREGDSSEWSGTTGEDSRESWWSVLCWQRLQLGRSPPIRLRLHPAPAQLCEQVPQDQYSGRDGPQHSQHQELGGVQT